MGSKSRSSDGKQATSERLQVLLREMHSGSRSSRLLGAALQQLPLRIQRQQLRRLASLSCQ